MTGHDTGRTGAVRCRRWPIWRWRATPKRSGTASSLPFSPGFGSHPFPLIRSVRPMFGRPPSSVPTCAVRPVWSTSPSWRPAAARRSTPTGCTPAPAAPTVLVYGHHDVQPVDPVEEWTSPPFDPVIVDGECRARGAIDDKGQTLYQIEAARGLLAGERPATRQPQAAHRGRGGGRQPPLRVPPGRRGGPAGLRRGGRIRHRDDQPGRALHHRRHARPGRLRRGPADGVDRPAQRDVGRDGPQRRPGGRPPGGLLARRGRAG